MSISESAAFEPQTCAWCFGGGHRPEGVCPVCRGRGAILVRHPARVCPECRCTGRAPDSSSRVCPVCGGAGWEGARLSRESVTGGEVKEQFDRFNKGE